MTVDAYDLPTTTYYQPAPPAMMPPSPADANTVVKKEPTPAQKQEGEKQEADGETNGGEAASEKPELKEGEGESELNSADGIDKTPA
jgi:hypothetical protein